ncbi:glycosyltransferase [Actinomadura vinacea]|uniref:Glycosyltransferase n=1 Tax=Actinomadura vinacea TaxID=115336 RepID=A0ABN3JW98_9ACTN
MTRRHIAMVSIPAPGHVNPSLEIIRELVARGHRVTYANDPSYADTITAVGAEPVPYRSTLPGHDEPGAWPDDPIEQIDLFLDDAIAMLPTLRAAYEHDRPDLFLYDMTGYPARVLAEDWGIPCMQLSPSAVAWEGYAEDNAEQLEAMRSDPRGAEHHRRFTAWLEANGATETDGNRFVAYPERGLALIPRAMQPNADRVDPRRYTFIGPCLGDRADQGDWQPPSSAEKVLLISLGSAFTDRPAFYRECLKAFGGLPGWHVVLQIGRHVKEDDLGAVPANVEVHRWVPQLAVLERADAFVTHAGSGGVNEGLYCGVPMIAVPQAVDQFMNADMLAEIGVGRRIDAGDATAEALRTALLDLTSDDEVAAGLAGIRAELRTEGGTARAADLVEELLPARNTSAEAVDV